MEKQQLDDKKEGQRASMRWTVISMLKEGFQGTEGEGQKNFSGEAKIECEQTSGYKASPRESGKSWFYFVVGLT